MRIKKRTVIHARQDFDLLQSLLQLELIFGLDFFPNQPKRIAIGYGTVVVVLVDIVAKQGTGIIDLLLFGLPICTLAC